MRLVRRRDGDERRLKVLNTLRQGVLWTQEFENVVLERFLKEVEVAIVKAKLQGFYVNGVEVAIVEKSKVDENSVSATRVMGLTRADMVVIVVRNGKLSLRSRDINVLDPVVALGDGHLQAAGARIGIPLLMKLASIVTSTAVLSYVENVLKQYEACIRRVG
jgi:oligoribonuclease NrnB/cAMP/cGMP phosphodiesterase (DHH superfamily)